MKKNTKTGKTTQYSRTIAPLTERALADVVGGDNGTIHVNGINSGGK